ncbi:MAG: NAD-dependent protein deacylase, partial [Fusobacterium sp.]|nr:NAD-dependent protein deacylase [Fusobacterium sp.]
MEDKLKLLSKIIKNSKYLVFFTGSGVSTDSGLKSFRGKDGLYSSLYKNKYQPEEILSIDFFNKNKKIFIEYIEEVLSIKDVKPNKGHKVLAKLEEFGILKAVITQNIDNLH